MSVLHSLLSLTVVLSAAVITIPSAAAQTELNIPDNLGKRFVIGFGPNNNAEDWYAKHATGNL